MQRRNFIGCCLLSLTAAALKGKGANLLSSNKDSICFGVISDVHEDLQKDACLRMSDFITKANQQDADFIIQLGDMCHSKGADKILSVYNTFKGEKYHVLGNHEMDNDSKASMLQKYSMPNGYHFFDKGGVRFIILDCCYTRKAGVLVDYDHGNYFVDRADRDIIHPKEIEWAKEVITTSPNPCVIFSHQAFDEIGGSVPNRADFRTMLREVNTPTRKVIAMICGHHHIDAHSKIEGVDYLQINSASYQWIENGTQYSNGCMAEYKDSLYSFITIDLSKKEMRIIGRRSEYLSPKPRQEDFSPAWRAKHIHNTAWKYLKPVISDRKINW